LISAAGRLPASGGKGIIAPLIHPGEERSPMFCPGCGKPSAPQETFCIQCGARLPESIGEPGYAVPPPADFSGVAASATPASYLWGNIHGWGMLVGGPLLFLLFLFVLLAPDSDQDARLGAIILMVGLALATITGLGLVLQMKMGLILVYIWTGLHVALVFVALLAMVADPKAALPALVLLLFGVAFWSVCSVYYYRRRSLFH
jgi:hypothetical protein